MVRCDCGNEKSVVGYELRSGHTTSCGCHSRAASRARFAHVRSFLNGPPAALRHGEARTRIKTAEWLCWNNMKYRCRNPNAANFKYYGGRGIKVCDRWVASYEDFLSDMGRKPSAAHSIDRIDVNGNYEPTNCRWATSSEQKRNQRRWLAHV